jgi:transcriptional regulator with XRE-family HTH domain
MPHRLPNYLKTYRKRAGLSQDEVAFLLGCKGGAKVSRYERLARRPSVETAFGCEVVFGVPSRELLAGVFEKVEEQIRKRAQALAEKLNAPHPDRMTLRKLQRLRVLISAPEPELTKHGLSTTQ